MFEKRRIPEKDEKNISSFMKRKKENSSDEKEFSRRFDQNAQSLDNSNESDSLTVKEILEILMENEKQEISQQKNS